MAINQNHTAEELAGIKCAVVEKNTSRSRADFLKNLLEFNGYQVVVALTPPPLPKAPPPPPLPGAELAEPVVSPPVVDTFTVGVTDLAFNSINAIFGRLLKAPGGHVVTLGYWQQKDKIARDDVPYFTS